MKYRIDWQAGNKVVAILVYARWPPAAILDFIGSEIDDSKKSRPISAKFG